MAVIIGAVLFYFYSSCGFAGEIKAYSLYRDNAFYFGEKSCPLTWKLKAKSLEEIKSLPNTDKVEIMAKEETKELEDVLNEKFLGFNKYRAGEGKNTFFIYETICNQCGL